ncbi:MAG: YdcF family protein [Planctomycetaceae bacterium]|nr:YdcF family protein [Planctomycetaceae bacterium]
MYYIITSLLEPLPLLLFLLGAALLSIRIRSGPRSNSLRFAWLIYGLLIVVSLPAFSYVALGTLEWQYSAEIHLPEDPQAIVVLSGHTKKVQHDLEVVLGDDTLYRCLTALNVYQERPCPIIVCGGNVDDNDATPALAEAMQSFLISHAIPEDQIIVESTSHSTYENAVEAAKLIRERGFAPPILLVTDITHLARSERCFNKQGIDVVPIGCRFNTPGFEWSYYQFIPNPGAIESVHIVAHEWLGLGWYWLRDRI